MAKFNIEEIKAVISEEIKKTFEKESLSRLVHHELEEVMWQLYHNRIEGIIKGVIKDLLPVNEARNTFLARILEHADKFMEKTYYRDIFKEWEVQKELKKKAVEVVRAMDVQGFVKELTPAFEATVKERIEEVTKEYIEGRMKNQFNHLLAQIQDMWGRIGRLEEGARLAERRAERG